MKKIILILMMGWVSSAHGVVTDAFECSMKIYDNVSNDITTQKINFNVARIPLSSSPAPDVRLTSSSTSQEVNVIKIDYSLQAVVGLSYSHGTRIDAEGKVLQAKQLSCFGITLNYCERGNGSPPCLQLSRACQWSNNPFEPNSIWTDVNTFDDVPMFDERVLIDLVAIPSNGNHESKGRAELSCKYKGTFK